MLARIVIPGGCVAGKNPAEIASGFQADVAIFDVCGDRQRYLEDSLPANVSALFSDQNRGCEAENLAVSV